MHCPECGFENEQDAHYCERCGHELDTISSSLAYTPPPPKKEGMSSSIKILLVVIVVLVVVFAGLMGVILKTQTTPTTPASNVTPVVNQPISATTGIPVSEVPGLAQEIYKVGGSLSSITYNGVTLDKNQCLYILSKAIVMINTGQTGNIPINQYGSASNPYGTVTSATITRTDYVNMAQRTYTWMDNNGVAPNYVGITQAGQADLSPDRLVNLYSKILTQYKSAGKLPETVQIP